MIDFLSKLWPYLTGGLICWLLAGWFARKLKHSEPPIKVEKIVEKKVDNPQHIALIRKLEKEKAIEISGLRTRLSGLESASTPVKTVDNPEHLKKISHLEAKLVSLKNSKNNAPQAALSGATKTVDNPAHIKRISELEAQVSTLQKTLVVDLAAAKAAGINLKSDNDFTAIEGIGPSISDLIQADGIKSFSQLAGTPVTSIQSVLDKAGPSYKTKNPGTWPDQANLAANNRWTALKALQVVLIGGVYPDATTVQKSKAGSNASATNKTATDTPNVVSLNKATTNAAGFRVKSKDGRDDFTIVEGISPKINDLIHDEGIHTYEDLGGTKVEKLQQILAAAGSSYNLIKPGTWPAQADMAAANKWDALKIWQDELDGGK